MKLMIAFLVTLLTGFRLLASAYTEEELKRLEIPQLLPAYYGDVELDFGMSLWWEKNLQAPAVRRELNSRQNLTEELMKLFRQDVRSNIFFLYSLLGLAEFGKPSNENHSYILAEIKESWSKEAQLRSTGAELVSHDAMVLMGMGAYLAGRPSPESEPILLEMLSRGEIKFGLPYTLRMVEKNPNSARLDALRHRNYGTKPLGEDEKRWKGYIDESILRIEANLRRAEGARLRPISESEALNTKVPPAPPRPPAKIATTPNPEFSVSRTEKTPLVWPWLAGFAAVIVIIALVFKRRR